MVPQAGIEMSDPPEGIPLHHDRQQRSAQNENMVPIIILVLPLVKPCLRVCHLQFKSGQFSVENWTPMLGSLSIHRE